MQVCNALAAVYQHGERLEFVPPYQRLIHVTRRREYIAAIHRYRCGRGPGSPRLRLAMTVFGVDQSFSPLG